MCSIITYSAHALFVHSLTKSIAMPLNNARKVTVKM